MPGAERLIELGAAIYVETVQRRRRAPLLGILLLIIALVVFFVALGFLVAAAFQGLEIYLRPVIASLVMAGALAVIAIIVLLWARWSFAPRIHHGEGSEPVFDHEAREFLDKVGEEINSKDGHPVMEGLVSAFALGFAKGLKRPHHHD